MRIAITGATGFVGRALIERLRKDAHEIFALTRQAAEVPGATRTFRVPSLVPGPELDRALEGADAVVHLAARVHVMQETAPDADRLYAEANVVATEAVLGAARKGGVQRVVYISTAKVFGEGRPAPYSDHDAPAPVGPYSESKVAAEEAVARGAESWCILRPPLVYGPDVGGNFRRLLRLAELSARWPVPLGGVNNQRSLIFVGNFADVIARAATDPRAAGQRFAVSDGEDVSTAELLRRIAKAMQKRARLLAVPPPVMRGLLTAVGKRAEADRLFESFTVDSRRVRDVLDWTPPATLEQGLARTVEWWQRTRGHA